jgi:type IV secretory pathway VirD2 relaxase
MARDYTVCARRVQALVTLELCPENDLERIQKLLNEVNHERYTRLDRGLLAKANDNIVVVMTADEQDPARQTMRLGPLKTLERLGLATEMELRIRHRVFRSRMCHFNRSLRTPRPAGST